MIIDKKGILLSAIISIIIFGCSNPEDKNTIQDLNNQLEACATELEDLKNTPELRFQKANEYLNNEDLSKARNTLADLISNYPKSKEATTAQSLIKKIDRDIETKKAEDERVKNLGFKALKTTSKVELKNLTVNIEKISLRKTWTFDAYGDRYFKRDARRGSKNIVARVTIASEINNPNLPPLLVYSLSGGKLSHVGTMEYAFRRWKDYGSYLGNYADYSNDFSHTRKIPFNLGYEISESRLEAKTIYVLVKNDLCVTRETDRFSNPTVLYSLSNCKITQTLTVDDVKNYYHIIKIFN